MKCINAYFCGANSAPLVYALNIRMWSVACQGLHILLRFLPYAIKVVSLAHPTATVFSLPFTLSSEEMGLKVEQLQNSLDR